MSRLPCTPQKCTTQVQMFHQAVWCRKHKAGNKEGLYSAKGTPPAKPLSSCSVFISWHCSVQRMQCSYQKVWFFFFCFKYQNYKNQFINCFSKTTTKTKQPPESKQNKILSKVLIALLLKLKPSTHSHVTGKRKGGLALLGDHMA